MIIDKDKLPKGLSYALKTTVLTQLLDDNGLPLPVSLYYCDFDIFFEATYVPANDEFTKSRLRIRVGSVTSNRCREAREYLHNTVFPEFVQWMAQRNALPVDSTRRFGLDNMMFRRDFA